MNPSTERDYLGKAVEIAIRLAVIAVIVLASYRIVSPFLLVVVWGMVLAITLHPVYDRVRRVFGGKAKLAGALFIVMCLAIVVVPTWLLTESVLDAAVPVVEDAQAGTLVIPAPTEKVKEWPLVGEKVYALWQSATVDLQGTAKTLQPQLLKLVEKVISGVSGLGRALLETIFAVIIAGILMMTSGSASRGARSVAQRLAGDEGPPIVDLTVSTIRSVVKGVVLVAVIQGLLAAIGLAIAGVPGTGLWALLTMMLAVMQLPPLIVLVPIAIWVFANADSTAIAVFFAVWSILVSVSDGFLKPLLLGRGVKVPMLVILVGAIGGLLRSGVIGLFVGPVVLAIFYQLFRSWVREEKTGPEPKPDAGTEA
jgi:predicted PurR-regulated permease PerM